MTTIPWAGPDRAVLLGLRKEIYEALHPEVTHGATGGTNAGKCRSEVAKLATSVDRFTAATAKATGRSERSVQRDAERAKKLGGTLTEVSGIDRPNLDCPSGSVENPKQDRENQALEDCEQRRR